jgi:hypothetical protein
MVDRLLRSIAPVYVGVRRGGGSVENVVAKVPRRYASSIWEGSWHLALPDDGCGPYLRGVQLVVVLFEGKGGE